VFKPALHEVEVGLEAINRVLWCSLTVLSCVQDRGGEHAPAFVWVVG
jgi:hypothetical protein